MEEKLFESWSLHKEGQTNTTKLQVSCYHASYHDDYLRLFFFFIYDRNSNLNSHTLIFEDLENWTHK